MTIYRGIGFQDLVEEMVDAKGGWPEAPFTAYAGPSIWGSWQSVASHAGSVTFTIEYTAIGDVQVRARVKYWEGDGGGEQVTKHFAERTRITTSNSVGTVFVSFKGMPTGSAIQGTVSP